MKKFFATFALLVFLSISVFADGETPIGGGRACPPPEPGQPAQECPAPTQGNQTSTNSVETGSTGDDETGDSDPLGEIVEYLKSLFG